MNAVDQSAICVLYKGIAQTCLSLAAVGTLKRVGQATLCYVREYERKSSEERACCLLRNPAVVCLFC